MQTTCVCLCVLLSIRYTYICIQFIPSNKDNSQDYSKELSTLRSNLEKQCEENADLRLQVSVSTVTPVYICIYIHCMCMYCISKSMMSSSILKYYN